LPRRPSAQSWRFPPWTARCAKIPEGTQSGTTFRFKGKGIPYVGYKNRGDQLVTVFVEVPTRLTKEQKELLRKFDESAAGANSKKKTFMEKMKELFD